tara:strand:- start:11024 stop:11248 length:225 start_codon:yes stop_codon:yes gene_type:complete
MKKRILGALFGAAFLVAGFVSFSSVENAEAASRTGKWIDVYGGGSTPTHAYCSATFWRAQCLSGDKKSLSIAQE